jgi:hypothetical protein
MKLLPLHPDERKEGKHFTCDAERYMQVGEQLNLLQ